MSTSQESRQTLGCAVCARYPFIVHDFPPSHGGGNQSEQLNRVNNIVARPTGFVKNKLKKGDENLINCPKLKQLMDSRSVTQAELADAVGVSEAAISYILRGLKQPSLAVAQRMAEFLGVTVDELLTDP